MEVVSLLTPNSMTTSDTSTAVLYRSMKPNEDGEITRPTCFIDEADAVFGPRASGDHEDLRAFINAGYRRGMTVRRCAMVGRSIVLEEFESYAPMAIAGLDDLPETVMTRSVVVRMKRRGSGETVAPFRLRLHKQIGLDLAERISEWVAAHGPELATFPTLPDGIEDRAADVWEPLITVGDALGPKWSRRVRDAATALAGSSRSTVESLGVRLLTDLRAIFGDRDHVSTAEILTHLIAIEEAPWADMRGKPIDARKLSDHLARYQIGPKTIRDSSTGRPAKGYSREDLWDAWTRYSPPADPRESVTSVTTVTSPPNPSRSYPRESVTSVTTVTPHLRAVTDVTDVTDLRTPAGLSPDTLDALDAWDTFPEAVGDPGYITDPETDHEDYS
jgi:hypothetical protein